MEVRTRLSMSLSHVSNPRNYSTVTIDFNTCHFNELTREDGCLEIDPSSSDFPLPHLECGEMMMPSLLCLIQEINMDFLNKVKAR